MNGTIAKSITFGAAALLAGLLLAAPALADGLPSKGKAAAAPDLLDGRACGVSGNVGATTDFVFRGISQTNEEAAVQGGVEFTCGRFYVGAWGSSFYGDEGATWLNAYGGFKTTTGPVTWDIGFIYYSFPGSFDGDWDNIELKLGASGEVWKGGALAGTVYYAPDYVGTLGSAWTLEGSFAQALPTVGIFSPTVSATVGHTYFSDELFGFFDLDYTYWNVGLTLAFHEKWAVDLRYWDTNGDGLADLAGPWADDRFVASVKYRF